MINADESKQHDLAVMKSSISEVQKHLITLMQKLHFGRIENLRIVGGDPIFDPPPRIIRKLKIGGENGSRPEARQPDFRLKQQHIEMLEAIAALGEGLVSIEVKHGLAFSMEIEYTSPDGGGGRG